MSRRSSGYLLQVARARSELDHYVRRWEYEIRARAKAGYLDTVGTACRLLLEKMVRIQGHETQETREYEIKMVGLQVRSERLWEPPGKPVVKAKPRLSLIPGGVPSR